MTRFIPAYPSIDATIRADSTGELIINGTSRPVEAATLELLRAGIIARCAATARQVRRPVRVQVVDITGSYTLAIHPDAYVQVLDEQGNVPDAPEGSRRAIGQSPCRVCGNVIALGWESCPECGTREPHDVQSAPASARLNRENDSTRVTNRASSEELLARWVPPASALLAPAAEPEPEIATIVELDDDLDRTRVVVRKPRRPAPTLRFSGGEVVNVSGSVLIGRNPAANAGEVITNLVSIKDDSRTVSKTHLRADWREGTPLWITDRQSANGVIVERGDSEPTPLLPGTPFKVEDGDRILVGDQSCIVSIPSSPPPSSAA